MRLSIYTVGVSLALVAAANVGCGQRTDFETSQKRQGETKSLAVLGKRTGYQAALETNAGSGFGLVGGLVQVAPDTPQENLHSFFSPVPGAGLDDDHVFDDAAKRIDDVASAHDLAADQLVLSAAMSKKVGPFFYVAFQRSLNDRLVRDGLVWLIYQKDAEQKWQLREVHNRGFLTLGVLESSHAISEPVIQTWYDVAPDAIKDMRAIYFAVHGEGLHPAKTFKLSYEGQDWSVVASEATGKVLEAYPLAFDFKASATVYSRSYMDPQESRDLSFATWRSGTTTGVGNADGKVIGIDETVPLTLTLSGSRTQVMSGTTTTAYVIPNVKVADGEVKLLPTAVDLQAANAFVAVSRINGFARTYLSADEAPILGRATGIKINVAGSCNAFYTPQTRAISVFSAGNGCANLSLVNDVMYHEWGHGLDDATGINPGIQDGAFSEGIGDILSGLYIGAPELAPGFRQDSRVPIRNLANSAHYPEDMGEVHAEGQIIGGAFWDLRQGLVAKYGVARGSKLATRYFTNHLLVTDSYLDSYNSVLRLDDDDNDPATPSPNACIINAAFARHGLAVATNCTDADKTAQLYGDESVLSALADVEGTPKILISHPTAENATICFNDHANCVKPGTPIMKMAIEGSKLNRVQYSYPMPVPVMEQSKYTVFLYDSSKKEVGWRTFVFKSR